MPRLQKNSSFFIIAARFASSIAAFILLFYTARLLGPGERGILSLVLINIQFSLIVSSIFAGSNINHVLNSRILPADAYRVLTLAFFWVVISSSIGSFLVLSQINQESAWLTWFVAIQCLLSVLTSTIATILLGYNKLILYNTIPLLVNACTVILLFSYVCVSHTCTLEVVILSYSFSNFLCFLYLIRRLFKTVSVNDRNPRSVLPSGWIKSTFREGLLSQIVGILLFIVLRGNTYIISLTDSRSLLGKYTVAQSLTEIVSVLSLSYALVIYNMALTDRYSASDLEKKIDSYIVKIIFVSAFGLGFIYFLSQNLFSQLLGPSYGGLSSYVLALSPGTLSISVITILIYYFSAKRLYLLLAAVLLPCVVIMAITNIALYQLVSIYSAPLSFSIASVFSGAILYYLFKVSFSKDVSNQTPN